MQRYLIPAPMTALRVVLSLCAMTVASAPTAAQTTWQPLPEVAPSPAGNPTTPSKVELGKMLYFDTRLSSSGKVSCFSCHNVNDFHLAGTP